MVFDCLMNVREKNTSTIPDIKTNMVSVGDNQNARAICMMVKIIEDNNCKNKLIPLVTRAKSFVNTLIRSVFRFFRKNSQLAFKSDSYNSSLKC